MPRNRVAETPGSLKDKHRLRPTYSSDGQWVTITIHRDQFKRWFDHARDLRVSLSETLDALLGIATTNRPQTPRRATYHSWTPEHLALAKNRALSPAQVAYLTGRTPQSVSTKRWKLEQAGELPPLPEPPQRPAQGETVLGVVQPKPAPEYRQLPPEMQQSLECEVCDDNLATVEFYPNDGSPRQYLCDDCRAG
jgi:hypothetical protein